MPFPFSPHDVAPRGRVGQGFANPSNPFVTTAPLRAFRPGPFPATRGPGHSGSGVGFRDPGAPGPAQGGGGTSFPDPGAPAPAQAVAANQYRAPESPFRVVGTQSRQGLSVGGRSFSRLAPSARFDDVAQHAIVLEESPVGSDSRLVFESFPGEWVESYKVKPYRKMGGHRMPQPQFATYQGGDWGPFPLTLTFRAGINDGSERDPNSAAPRDIESILITMQRKVDWLVALAFPLERQNTEAQRHLRRAMASGSFSLPGFSGSSVSEEAISNLRRNDPPFVLLVLGSWRVIRGYLMGIDWRWTPPFHPVSGRPYGAVVSMQFQPIQSGYPTWQTIREQAGFAGMSGPVQGGLPAAGQQRVAVTNNMLQNRQARASGTFAPQALQFDVEPADGNRAGGGTIRRRPVGS